MGDQKLGKVRRQFVERVDKAVTCLILDDLLKEKVLRHEEVEKMKDKYLTSREQATMLIDHVRRKGSRACNIAIYSICSRDRVLAAELGLTAFFEGSSSQKPPPAPNPTCIVEESEPVESRQGIKLCPPNVFEKIQNENADTKLGKVRTQLVEKMNKAVIYAVLDDLQEKQVLSEAETEEVKQHSTLTREQARMLIDGVRKKGPNASLIAIKCICSRDVFLAEELGLKAFLAELEGNLR